MKKTLVALVIGSVVSAGAMAADVSIHGKDSIYQI